MPGSIRSSMTSACSSESTRSKPARSIVNRLQREAFRTQTFAEKPAEFYVVIDDEHAIHSVLVCPPTRW